MFRPRLWLAVFLAQACVFGAHAQPKPPKVIYGESNPEPCPEGYRSVMFETFDTSEQVENRWTYFDSVSPTGIGAATPASWPDIPSESLQGIWHDTGSVDDTYFTDQFGSAIVGGMSVDDDATKRSETDQFRPRLRLALPEDWEELYVSFLVGFFCNSANADACWQGDSSTPGVHSGFYVAADPQPNGPSDSFLFDKYDDKQYRQAGFITTAPKMYDADPDQHHCLFLDDEGHFDQKKTSLCIGGASGVWPQTGHGDALYAAHSGGNTNNAYALYKIDNYATADDLKGVVIDGELRLVFAAATESGDGSAARFYVDNVLVCAKVQGTNWLLIGILIGGGAFITIILGMVCITFISRRRRRKFYAYMRRQRQTVASFFGGKTKEEKEALAALKAVPEPTRSKKKEPSSELAPAKPAAAAAATTTAAASVTAGGGGAAAPGRKRKASRPGSRKVSGSGPRGGAPRKRSNAGSKRPGQKRLSSASAVSAVSLTGPGLSGSFSAYGSDHSGGGVRSTMASVAMRDYLDELSEILARDNFAFVNVLGQLTNTVELDNLARSLVELFQSGNKNAVKAKRFLTWTVKHNLSEASSPSDLFRSASFSTKVLLAHVNLDGHLYLRNVLASLIQETLKKKSMEIDASQLSKKEAKNLNKHLDELKETADKYMSHLYESIPVCPLAVKLTCHVLREQVHQRFPNQWHRSLSDLFFLRFVCPAIAAPDKNGIVSDVPNDVQSRNLLLVSKVVQAMGNGATIGAKEQYMEPLKAFIESKADTVEDILIRLSTEETGSKESMRKITSQERNVSLAHLYAVIDENADLLVDALDSASVKTSGEEYLQQITAILDVTGTIPEKRKRMVSKVLNRRSILDFLPSA